MRFPLTSFLVLSLALLTATQATFGADAAGCTPPPGFTDIPHPAIAAKDPLVVHTEEIVIDRPLAQVLGAMSKPLNRTIQKSTSLPGVAGEFLVSKGEFGSPGSRRIVCLSDGGSVEEEILEREGSPDSARFRYIVWNYHTPKAKPIAYGIGEFRSKQIDTLHTRVAWVYSFRLKEDIFPGNLGAFGRFLLRVGFVDRDYAAMMRGVLNGYKVDAEKLPINQPAELDQPSK